ncbi:hypothetical protein D9M68_995120 [compost metagenome]
MSATYAVSQAVAGRALQAAAYATVYADGGYAVTDPEAFAEEFAWQVSAFRALSEDGSGLAAPAG